MQEMCTYPLLKLCIKFQIFKLIYYEFEFSNCEKYFTIAGINAGTCEIIYILAGFQVQACPGATAFENVWSAIKPVRPSDQENSYMIQVWARGSTFKGCNGWIPIKN